jgi:hypothetical protein
MTSNSRETSADKQPSLWRRIVHALFYSPCEGDYYCRMCGRVQR